MTAAGPTVGSWIAWEFSAGDLKKELVGKVVSIHSPIMGPWAADRCYSVRLLTQCGLGRELIVFEHEVRRIGVSPLEVLARVI